MDEEGEATAQAKCLYINERFQIPVKGSQTVEKLQKQIAKAAAHPAEYLRLYHHGYPLLKPKKTLASLGFGSGEPRVYYIYLQDPPLPSDECYVDGKPNLRNIKRQFDTSGLLDEKDAIRIVKDAVKILRDEGNLVRMNDPCSVIGDIHGQWYDMAGIISNAGKFGQRNMLFLGDYVDRGAFSSEVMLYLLAAKINYPDSVFLLRGNHESRKTTKSYGSQEEFKFKYGRKFNKVLTEAFDHFPVYGLIESAGKKILCMHGGISPNTENIDDLDNFNRIEEPPKAGVLKDTLWADPYEDLTAKKQEDMPDEYDLNNLDTHKPKDKPDYGDDAFHDSSRGKGLKLYGYPAVLEFLKANELVGIFRGHEQKETGLEQYKFGPKYKFPAVTTVFSAPNYTDKSQNTGAVVNITNGVVKFKHFTWALHPQFFPFDHKGHHENPFDRDFDTEDFIQFVNYNQHEALRAIPLHKLKGEYLAMFEKNGEHPDGAENISRAIEAGGSFTHKKAMGDRQLDDKEMKKVKKDSAGIMKKYEGFDHFKDALDKEDSYEKDPDDKSTYKQALKLVDSRTKMSSSAVGTSVLGALGMSTGGDKGKKKKKGSGGKGSKGKGKAASKGSKAKGKAKKK
jgi:diadenosine tetraphosphatase ApaH/serine/threonine PP2A family protein phosphatase